MAPVPGRVVDDSLQRLLGDGMEKTASDTAAPSAGWSERASPAVLQLDERRFLAGGNQRRVVKLMATNDRAG